MLKFWNYNLVDQPQTVITPSTENALFPIENLKDPRRTKVFRSTGNSVNIVFDMINAQAVDSVVLAPHSSDGWGIDTPVTIEANATNTWGAPAFSTTLTSSHLDPVHEVAIREFASQTYRYWRLSFTATSYVELAYVFIGAVQKIGVLERSMDYGWQFIDDDLTTYQESVSGIRFSDIRGSRKRMIFDINLMNNDEFDDYLSIYDYNRKHRPFFMKIESATAINDDDRLAGLFYFDSIPAVSNPSHALWNTSAQISEAL